MSRWKESFDSHPFQTTWSHILSLSESIAPDDLTVITDIAEIARLKKIITFINELILSCDPELIPDQTWNNFYSQAVPCLQNMSSFQDTRNIQFIVQANAHLDNLITYIRPYQVVIGKAAQAAQKAYSLSTKEINNSLKNFSRNAEENLNVIIQIKTQAISKLEELERINQEVIELEERLFDDNSKTSVSTRIKELESEVTQSHDKIIEFFEDLFDGESENESIEQKIKSGLSNVESDAKESATLINGLQKKVSEFDSYYSIVFGEKDENNVRQGGLKEAIKNREKELDKFKETQQLKYKTLVEEIEGLLPSATSAGLASAYHDMKESFDSPIINNTRLFYVSIICLILTALISITQEASWTYIKFHDIPELTKLASNFLYKAPIILPVIWLALYSSKRRSEALRLQQEYAHKEALAKSFQNFKAQIEALGEETPLLMNKLLEAAIDAVSKNASDTLDKKHDDKTPVHQTLDGALDSLGKMKGLFEFKKPSP
ncbi:hypothetical protein [Aeromonas dhakensis]|uniref:hypothetical protein n=1 Tax=Aeromonas dhakensis TaxID=196024 RepID=UPI00111761D2|nr:hypothetical protein [Aeromonas dhakensis]